VRAFYKHNQRTLLSLFQSKAYLLWYILYNGWKWKSNEDDSQWSWPRIHKMEGTNLKFQAADIDFVSKTHVTERCLILIRYVHAYKQKETKKSTILFLTKLLPTANLCTLNNSFKENLFCFRSPLKLPMRTTLRAWKRLHVL